MSVTERQAVIFGAITLQDMSRSRDLTMAVLPLLKRACEFSGGRFAVGNVVDGLISGKFQLWGALAPPLELQAVAVTHARPYESGMRALEVMLLGGPEIDGMLAFLPEFARIAAEHQCVKVIVFGPKSWESRFPPGWRAAARIYEHDLERPATR
jgi:hypothetical protein